MKMDDCKHERMFFISGKTSDMNSWTYPNGLEEEGYVPTGIMDSCGDYLEVKVCCDCKVLLNFNPDAVEQAEKHAEIVLVEKYISDDEYTLENIISNVNLSEEKIREILKFLITGGMVEENEGFYSTISAMERTKWNRWINTKPFNID